MDVPELQVGIAQLRDEMRSFRRAMFGGRIVGYLKTSIASGDVWLGINHPETEFTLSEGDLLILDPGTSAVEVVFVVDPRELEAGNWDVRIARTANHALAHATACYVAHIPIREMRS